MRTGSWRPAQWINRMQPVLVLTLAAGLLLLLLARPAAAQTPDSTGTPTRAVPTPRPATESMNPESWILIEKLPEDATQADYGEQYYIFVCQSCHGDLGRGLTADWIAQWAPDDQNCWQTKCHASSHPPDGFTIPHYVPPVIGEDALLNFRTAFDLYNYIRNAMPYQAPKTLLDEEYWSLTAYLLRENQMGDLTDPLTPDTAVSMVLRPGEASQATSPEPEAPITHPTGAVDPVTRSPAAAWPYWGGGLLLLVAVIFAAWRLLNRRS